MITMDRGSTSMIEGSKRSYLQLDRTWRAMIHSDHYVTDSVPGAGTEWNFM